MGSVELSTCTLPPRDGFVDGQNHNPANVLYTTESLEALQTDEQRHVLDIVAQLRKSGKSSVLEALTEIPFPRNDNLCTRFATEIILRRATTDMLIIKVIPDSERPPHGQDQIKCFDKAADSIGTLRAFAKDTLSVVIQGPQRPQLTLVDLPGIIQSETKDASKEDVSLVSAITEHYISQSRTICLAVVSATNDYANQPILNKVRRFDPKGDRTLGIITKPDRLPAVG
ncbi:hypothetical protein Egran_03670 [Elaphomyces granulatus]|uniref:Dynamin GTPase domain-containing protein n=1 Tax=Elaphomyces granulatus TaxID=519963 RepID=A0A232LXN2_9EURO|nr:hypothetical protein Egran_03670 [Elaphomyces granulatus]